VADILRHIMVGFVPIHQWFPDLGFVLDQAHLSVIYQDVLR
jgi:hypothetical protein